MKTLSILTLLDRSPNPFIWVLANGIASDAFRIDINYNNFWAIEKKYDVIQIHQPEIFLNSRTDELPLAMFFKRLSETLRQWKRSGTKIVYTLHDMIDHTRESDEAQTGLYKIIESEADAIIHLGNYSKNLMLHNKPVDSRIHVVIPHHVYDTIYPFSIPQSEAKQALGIDEKYRVILVFGVFRDKAENLLVKNAFERLDDPDKYLFAPGWYHDRATEQGDNTVMVEGACWLGRGTVDRKMSPYCFSAADVVLIQRLHSLNSGNIPMGFLFNKTVVAPAIGNMKELIDNVHNYSFDPFDTESLLMALGKGLERSRLPQTNEPYARKHWSTERTCNRYRQLYRQLTG